MKSELPKKDVRDVAKAFDNNVDSFGAGVDSFTGFNEYGGQNNNTFLEGGDQYQNRINYYHVFTEMSQTNFIHRALQVVADDACQKNEDGNTVSIYSDDENIKNILESMFHRRLNLNKELWSIIYETIKFGDNFYEVIPDSYDNPKEIVRIRYLDPYKVNRIEKNGKLVFYTYTTFKEKDENDPVPVGPISTDYNQKQKEVQYRLQPWQIVHFKVTDKDFYPYGGSLLKAGVRTFRRLSMLEDAILVYRLARVPERRVFKIGVGNLSTNEANRFVQKVQNSYRTQQVLDNDGRINRKAAALSITQDVFIPVREGETGTNVEMLSGGQGLHTIDDLKYFRDQILMTLNIPPAYLGFDGADGGGGGQARGSLAIQDVKFARFVERIQYYIEEGLTKIAYIELFFNKIKKEDLSNFKIELTPPSNMKEIMDIEFVNQKMSLISAMKGTDLFPTKYILKNVMHLSKKEINDIMLFKDLERQSAGGAQGGDMMGGGMPMGGGDMGGMPMGDPGAPMSPPMDAGEMPPEGGAPLMQDALIKFFGKDILTESKKTRADFIKLVKIAEEWQKKQNEKGVEDEEVEEETTAEVLHLINNLFQKEHNKKNEFVSLFYENECGGLSFADQTFTIFGKPKGRPGRKIEGRSDIIVEEITKSIKGKK